MKPTPIRTPFSLPALLPLGLILGLPFGVIAACGSSASRPSTVAEAAADPTGATLVVAEGPLDGFSLTIPPGGLHQRTTLSVAEALPIPRPGFAILGPSAAVAPAGIALSAPAKLVLPFDDGSAASIVVLVRQASGQILEIGPVDLSAPGLAEVQTPVLGTFWVADRFFGGFALGDYLPRNDGDSWTFENGLSARMDRIDDEPNVTGSVYRLAIETQGDDLGLYVSAPTPEGVLLLGDYSTVGGRNLQRLFDRGAPFLPAAITVGQESATAFTYVGHAPYGALLPGEIGDGVLRRRFTLLGSLGLVGRRLTDLLKVEVTLHTVAKTPSGAGAVRVETWAITLAKGIGPVRIEALGTDGYLLEAMVDGERIGQMP